MFLGKKEVIVKPCKGTRTTCKISYKKNTNNYTRRNSCLCSFSVCPVIYRHASPAPAPTWESISNAFECVSQWAGMFKYQLYPNFRHWGSLKEIHVKSPHEASHKYAVFGLWCKQRYAEILTPMIPSISPLWSGSPRLSRMAAALTPCVYRGWEEEGQR